MVLMSNRTRRLLLFGLPAALLASAIAAALLWPRTAITRENAARIQVGMTLAEVESILGGPVRDETTGPCVPDLAKEGPGGTPHDLDSVERWIDFLVATSDATPWPRWQSNQVMIAVLFDTDGRVSDCHFFPVRRADETLLDRLRRWLGL
jgi:hypothetical protein